jgi:hypothetical protein
VLFWCFYLVRKCLRKARAFFKEALALLRWSATALERWTAGPSVNGFFIKKIINP